MRSGVTCWSRSERSSNSGTSGFASSAIEGDSARRPRFPVADCWRCFRVVHRPVWGIAGGSVVSFSRWAATWIGTSARFGWRKRPVVPRFQRPSWLVHWLARLRPNVREAAHDRQWHGRLSACRPSSGGHCEANATDLVNSGNALRPRGWTVTHNHGHVREEGVSWRGTWRAATVRRGLPTSG
jgi:hypothetical protein